MRVAALYDVHGNLPALEAVLADPRCAAADVIVSGGDLVAGPLPAECLDRLEGEGERARFLSGNADRETTAPSGEEEWHEKIGRWSASRLTDAQVERVRRWPLTVDLEVPALGRVLFCHATPDSDLPILTRATPDEDVARELGVVNAAVVVTGHTHVQYDRRVGDLRMLNAGSVGMPYEGSPDARWAILDEDGVELVSTPYDARGALDLLAATGFPAFDEWFAPALRGEVTAEEATETFESRRLGT
jgi:predicted phosphodiesterase